MLAGLLLVISDTHRDECVFGSCLPQHHITLAKLQLSVRSFFLRLYRSLRRCLHVKKNEKHKVRALQLSQCGSPFLPSMPGAGLHDTSDKASLPTMPSLAKYVPKSGKVANVLKPQIAPHKWVPNGGLSSSCNSHDHTWEACVAGYPVQQFPYLEELLSMLTRDCHCACLCMSMCQPVINSIFLNECIACLLCLARGCTMYLNETSPDTQTRG